MAWNWTEPTPMDDEGTVDVEIQLTKPTGEDRQDVVSGKLHVSAASDLDGVLEGLFQPAVETGWVLTAKRVRRYESDLVYGG